MNKPAASLNDWIRTATAGLPPSAVTKFSAEIEDHAAESRQKHAAQGMTPDEADRAALVDLGDAQQVARTFRDLHFSRREFSRAAAFVLVLFIVSIVPIIASAISASLGTLGTTDDKALIQQLVLFWEVVGNPISSILGIFVARALLTFLREQYDIRVPSWAWRLYMACVILAIPFGVFNPGLILAQQLSSNPFEFFNLPLVQALYQVATIFVMVYIAAGLLGAALKIAFSVSRLAALSLTTRPIVGVLAFVIGLTGLGSLISVGIQLTMRVVLPPDFTYTPDFIASLNAITTPFMVLGYVLMAMQLGLFGAMRRPGAVLAR